MLLYEINSKKVVEFSLPQVNKPELSGDRQVLQLMTAPLALIKSRGIYLLTTKNMSPVDCFRENYIYTGMQDSISIPMHPVWADEETGKLKFSQVPNVKMASTIEELINEYTFPPEFHTAWFGEEGPRGDWAKFDLALDKRLQPYYNRSMNERYKDELKKIRALLDAGGFATILSHGLILFFYFEGDLTGAVQSIASVLPQSIGNYTVEPGGLNYWTVQPGVEYNWEA